MVDTVARIEELAARRGMSLAELSRRSGVNHSTVSAAKMRGNQLQVCTIAALCDAIGISLAEFFAEPGETVVRACVKSA